MAEPEPDRLRLDIAYDGTDFHGWARQPGLRTVQGTLEDALARVLGGEVLLTVAGRTDAGVHATGQVAHLDLAPAQRARLLASRAGEVSALAARVNGVLGAYADVTVREVREAPAGFDARFSAVWRCYEYRIADRDAGYDPLQRARTARVPARLDEAAMERTAAALLGLYDFAAFCKPREEATTIRTLQEFGWQRAEDGVLLARVTADAFCHSMVRALVGACVAVGSGRLTTAEVVALRDAARRTGGFAVLPARGLTLTRVGYPDDTLLAVRAAQTRRRRDRE